MTTSSNILQQVQTYQSSELAYLHNSYALINTFNKRFRDFEKLTANLGSTVTFDKQPLFATNPTLVANFQPAAQRVQSLTVDQAVNTSYSFSSEQFIFNVKDYMDKFGRAAVGEIGSVVESSIANKILSSTYRFFGDGTTQITSFGQLATALSYHRNYGAPKDNTKGYLPDIAIPSIVNTGLSQFVLNRNNVMANSWELGSFSNCNWHSSNLLATQYSGTLGTKGTVLTIDTITRGTDGGITGIHCTGSTSGDTANVNDLFSFQDGVIGLANARYLTFVGHQTSACPVQCRVTANATANSGGIGILISPTLYDLYSVETGAHDGTIDPNKAYLQNVNVTIVAGMKIKLVPSHIAGLIISGDAGFLAMPRLPEEVPFPTANAIDPESGLSFRKYYGSKFGMNERGFVNDVIWGSTIVPEYALRVVFPLVGMPT
jgi:hypothetical protein